MRLAILLAMGVATCLPLGALVRADDAADQQVERRLAVFKQSLQGDPQNVDLLLVLARGYAEAGQLETAQSYAQRAATASPTNAEVRQVMGNLAYLQNDAAAAITHFQAADPAHQSAANQLNLALAYVQHGQLPEAREAYLRAEKLDAAVTAPYADLRDLLNAKDTAR